MIGHYDRDGNPITFRRWACLTAPEYRRIAQNDAGGYRVSTVWLGVDHGHGDGPPLIFETMLFGEGPRDQECWRWSTRKQARRGHKKLLTELRRRD